MEKFSTVRLFPQGWFSTKSTGFSTKNRQIKPILGTWKKIPREFSTACGKLLWKNQALKKAYSFFQIRHIDEIQLFFKKGLTRFLENICRATNFKP
ncbi:MAG: hypothetical protein E7629_07400 [Ruminococcaceae bacterium]|nr:hypothetical protein [Oscillospiraceae bacterium]